MSIIVGDVVVEAVLSRAHVSGPAEIWLVYKDEQGLLAPILGTGPITLPHQWQKAIDKLQEQQQ